MPQNVVYYFCKNKKILLTIGIYLQYGRVFLQTTDNGWLPEMFFRGQPCFFIERLNPPKKGTQTHEIMDRR